MIFLRTNDISKKVQTKWRFLIFGTSQGNSFISQHRDGKILQNSTSGVWKISTQNMCKWLSKTRKIAKNCTQNCNNKKIKNHVQKPKPIIQLWKISTDGARGVRTFSHLCTFFHLSTVCPKGDIKTGLYQIRSSNKDEIEDSLALKVAFTIFGLPTICFPTNVNPLKVY